MGDHLLGCGHGPLRIRRQDALRHVLYHALLIDHPGVRIEQRSIAPGRRFPPVVSQWKTRLFRRHSAQHSTASVLVAGS